MTIQNDSDLPQGLEPTLAVTVYARADMAAGWLTGAQGARSPVCKLGGARVVAYFLNGWQATGHSEVLE